MQDKKGRMNGKYIVIVGCGRLGSYLANTLSQWGASVVIVDLHEESFKLLSPHFGGFRLTGDAVESGVMRQAKLDRADLLVAATHDDNVNLLVAQTALKVFKVPRVLARVYDPRNDDIYQELGIETICPITVAAELFLQAVTEGRLPGEER
ncbi:MAG: potassium transporter TrkA [Candidatus Coatesbacteria bacterium RBG_13_66_14]|uniref:Potassium transporter TrkA n=1 Tax=Candidatus Coatesbacteria bacterium RBG_13_66_14 TaxID=1817816 RepID=A0A1F5EXJ1_9BACT|nr:MAG: potassium transporter TrkA [Candidatus Coatesbacteria bacterium RBG_13_66_14]